MSADSGDAGFGWLQPRSARGMLRLVEGDRYFYGIIATSTATGEEILRIGTNDYDDYYPVCILEFHPQNLDVNQ